MASLWEKIQALEGPSLVTTGRGELFTVVAVDDDRIVIEVGPHRSSRSINRRQFERAETLGLFTTDVIPDQLNREKIALGRTAYAAAIIRKTFG
jgi:hypothetical protein